MLQSGILMNFKFPLQEWWNYNKLVKDNYDFFANSMKY